MARIDYEAEHQQKMMSKAREKFMNDPNADVWLRKYIRDMENELKNKNERLKVYEEFFATLSVLLPR